MSGDARTIAAGARDAVIRLFDIRKGEKIMKLKVSCEIEPSGSELSLECD